MTTSPCPLVYRLAGSPNLAATQDKLMTDNAPASCAVCGRRVDRHGPLAKVAGQNFTDQYWLADPVSTRVCPACTWCLTGKPPNTIRMWTILAAPGQEFPTSNPKAFLQNTPGLMLTSRGDTKPVVDILCDPPDTDWVASVAISGQKHVLPFAHINHGTGPWRVRMETCTITSTPAEFGRIIDHAAHLRSAKHSADSVLHLTPGPLKTRAALALWQQHATPLHRFRGSPVLELALWALTKETISDRTA